MIRSTLRLRSLRFVLSLAVGALALAASSAQAQAPGPGRPMPPPGFASRPGQPTPATGAGAGAANMGLDIDYAALVSAEGGTWADYSVTVPGRDDMPKVRYSLLNKTARALALEIDAPTPKGDVDVRIDYITTTPDTWTAVSGKMRLGEKVIDMPPQQVLQSLPLRKSNHPGDLVGTEDVKTPAGTFACRHYHRVVTDAKGGSMTFDLWMNEKVGPTGLMKSSMGPMTMLLAGVGKGAVSKIP